MDVGYRGLADLAPWRLDAAYRGWRDSRQAQGLPVPYAHWTVPTDLGAHLYGWQPNLPYPH
ncbi:hypothetical protein KBX71_26410 [Micromonospora sp. D93]|uniref:hypothetical protein n=1 Tax=Micromonospora sp. D93 TaxID=2824886 RepID=UPI001B369260|nr:hypothetical protein [Micromonospora sp. D93]MBQ1021394.1 hypothetical protein [Micromonospora sp. D93]